jgi:hypothetical protein
MTLLVEVTTQYEREFIRPFQDRNHLSQSICRDWEAQFAPAQPPPEEWW